jgi:hypothetical protein
MSNKPSVKLRALHGEFSLFLIVRIRLFSAYKVLGWRLTSPRANAEVIFIFLLPIIKTDIYIHSAA